MQIKHSVIDIPENNPFEFDKLERKQHAEILTQFITSIDEPLTMSVEAGWGHGKTTFFKMWEQSLRNQGYTCISFNAWESDYAEDPFIPFVSELRNAITSISNESNDFSKKMSEISAQLRKTGIQVAKRVLPVSAKILTAGLLDTDEIIEQATGDAIAKAIEQKFDEYDADKKSQEQFKSTLVAIAQELKVRGKKLPIIFMIDELDRCRPTYALTLLERIKHIFNVNGIVFILAIDRGQLFESIRTVYGSNTDSNRYLRRFLDYRYSLPDPKPEKYPDHLMSVFKHREQFIRVNGGNSYESTQFLETFIALSTCFGMRLRDQEHAFSILNVVWRTLQNNEDINPFILAALLVIKVANEDMYSKLIKSEISVQTLFDYIHQHPVGKTYMDKNYGYAFEAYMSLATESGDEIRVRTKELAERSSKHDIYPNAALKWQVMQPIFHSGMSKFEFTKVVKSIEATNHFKN